ncbi:hypothetical protein B484DRAFT_404848 [Ochromonadaceae sp. CCMP2298]|nr:hypothetical protein B484DRAFT_404848 [Ochromonadaceae sp. CCMP2298]
MLTSTSITVTDDASSCVLLYGSKSPSDKLWPLNADYVAYIHAALGSPATSTLLTALRGGYLACIPRLTANMVNTNTVSP